jgi:hypothetical protein
MLTTVDDLQASIASQPSLEPNTVRCHFQSKMLEKYTLLIPISSISASPIVFYGKKASDSPHPAKSGIPPRQRPNSMMPSALRRVEMCRRIKLKLLDIIKRLPIRMMYRLNSMMLCALGRGALIQIDSRSPSMVSSVWDEVFPHQHHPNCFDQSGSLPIFGFCLKFADRHSYPGFRACPKAQE